MSRLPDLPKDLFYDSTSSIDKIRLLAVWKSVALNDIQERVDALPNASGQGQDLRSILKDLIIVLRSI